MKDAPLLSIRGLQARQAIEPIDFELKHGQCMVIHAPPGFGKSILLHSMTALHYPRAGKVIFQGRDIHQLEPEALDILRLEFGYLPGQGQLMSNLSLYENLVLPLRYHTDLKESEIQKSAIKALKALGLDYIPGPLADRREQRLVAIARTLILGPELLILDEPSSGMDPEHADELWKQLKLLNQDKKLALIIATKNSADQLPFEAQSLTLRRRQTVS